MLTRDEIVKKLRDSSRTWRPNMVVCQDRIFGSYAAARRPNKATVDLVVEFAKPIGFKFLDLADYWKRCSPES